MGSTPSWPSGIGVQRRREQSGLADVVLLVEDDEVFRKYTVELLRSAGFEVIEAADGFAGWAALQRHRPKVAILDIILPNMSGYELCDKVRQHPDLEGMLIIAATGTDAEGSGFDVCLHKPFEFDDLLDQVRAGLER